MLSDPADMSGSGLGRKEGKSLGAGDFRDKEPSEEVAEWAGEVEVQWFTCSAGGLSVSPPPLPQIPRGQGGIDETSRKA